MPQQVSGAVPTHYWTSDVGRSQPTNNTFTLFNQSTHVHHHHNSQQNALPLAPPTANGRKEMADISASSNSEISARKHSTSAPTKTRASSVGGDNSTNGTILRETTTTDTDKRSGLVKEADIDDDDNEDEDMNEEEIGEDDIGDEDIEGDVVDTLSMQDRFADKRPATGRECGAIERGNWQGYKTNDRGIAQALDQKDKTTVSESLIELERTRNGLIKNGVIKNGSIYNKKRGRSDDTNRRLGLSSMGSVKSGQGDDVKMIDGETRRGDENEEQREHFGRDSSATKLDSLNVRKRLKRPRNGLSNECTDNEKGRWRNMLSKSRDYEALFSKAKRETKKDEDASYGIGEKEIGNEGVNVTGSKGHGTGKIASRMNEAAEEEEEDTSGDPKGDSTEREEMGRQVNGTSDPPSPRMNMNRKDKCEMKCRRKRIRRDGKKSNSGGIMGAEQEGDDEMLKESENESIMLSLGVGTESGATGGGTTTNEGVVIDNACNGLVAGYKSRARRYELVVHGCVNLGCAQWCTDRGLRVTMAIGSKALLGEMNVGSLGRHVLQDGVKDGVVEDGRGELVKVHGVGNGMGLGIDDGMQGELERKGGAGRDDGGSEVGVGGGGIDQEMRKRYHMALMGQKVEWMMKKSNGSCMAYLVMLAPFRKRSGAEICGVCGLILELSQRWDFE